MYRAVQNKQLLNRGNGYQKLDKHLFFLCLGFVETKSLEFRAQSTVKSLAPDTLRLHF